MPDPIPGSGAAELIEPPVDGSDAVAGPGSTEAAGMLAGTVRGATIGAVCIWLKEFLTGFCTGRTCGAAGIGCAGREVTHVIFGRVKVASVRCVRALAVAAIARQIRPV
ncbi:MAG: hypothetical protein H0U64_06040 [Gemmatimonadaceae bacterium]|nr:hypothetical protein [Gemmatimonadaceae bacterium]